MLFLFSTVAFTQEKGTNEIVAGVGFYSSNEILNTVEDIISGVSFAKTTVSPTINLTYKIAVKDNWFLYADGSYQTVKEDVIENNLTVGDVSHRYITIGFGTEYHYIVKEWFQMYSGGSVAYTSQNSDFTTSSTNIEDRKDGFFNFQVNAVGFRFGKSLAGIVELGYGYKGFANLALAYQF